MSTNKSIHSRPLAVNGYGLAYLHVMDGLAFGFHNLGEPMTLAELRKVFHGPLIGNCGYAQERAEQAIAEGLVDMIAFGRPFISNPDLVERFKNGWPLAEEAPMSDWYLPTGAKGYTEFPAYEPQFPAYERQATGPDPWRMG